MSFIGVSNFSVSGFSRILVTGGAGFIGSHLVEALVRAGFEVNVLDDFSTGSLENLKGCLETGKVQIFRGTVEDMHVVEKAAEEVEAIFHLAAITSVPFSIRHPQVTFAVNVEGTRCLLETCLKADVKRFVYVSSCSVYGEPEYLPIDELHPLRPISPYAESKVEAERLCMAYCESHGLKTVMLRLFNVYGPRMRNDQYSGVVARFIMRLKSGKPPIIYGDGEQTRDFIHVSDVVQALLLAVESRGAYGGTFNVGSGVPLKINDLAGLLTGIFGLGHVKPIHRRARAGDIRHSYADISRARAVLGFKPKIGVREGLASLAPTNRFKFG
ncbi:MAG: GDP-mannose 4,6-dehydratase [Candidatus Bathyarchaeia archaeon]